MEWGPGDNPGVRVLNLAGVGQSGWDILEDTINEVRCSRSLAEVLPEDKGSTCQPFFVWVGSESCASLSNRGQCASLTFEVGGLLIIDFASFRLSRGSC